MAVANSGSSALWVGDMAAWEFLAIHSELAAAIPLAASSTPEAASEMGVNAEPALLLFAQRFPGEFTARQVDSLRRRWPLARCLALLGPWCEGEPRSGAPLPGVARLYWHQWSPRVLREICKLVEGAPSEWSAPATSAPEERLLSADDWAKERLATNERPLIALQANHRQTAEALAALVEQGGFAPLRLRPGGSPPAGRAATVFDLALGSPDEWRSLAEACRANSGPVVALLGFPRPDDAARARDLGVHALLPKPLAAPDLLQLLNASTLPAASQGARARAVGTSPMQAPPVSER